MPLSRKLFTLVCSIGAAGMIGCTHSPSDMPTTMPSPETNMKSGGPTTMAVAPALPVAIPATPPPVATPAKVMTHELTKDQPYFPEMPAAGTAPSGTLRAGAKLLVLQPGAEYSQVETDMGITYWTPTEGLKALGK